MKRKNRVALLFLGGILLLVGITAGALASAVMDKGTIEILIQEKGTDGNRISIQVPGALVSAALLCVPNHLIRCEIEDDLDDLGKYLRLVSTVCDELAKLPDFVMVEVDERDEHVRITKEGSRLVVHVESDDESVFVALPLPVVEVAIAKLERCATS